jgi:hypothetical protein
MGTPGGTVEVQLSASELVQAATIGAQRHVFAIAKGLPDRHGFEGAGWDVHIEGAAGELAFCKATGRYWDATINTFKTGGDVGTRIQVRTRSKTWYDLLVRPDDRPDDIFVLVLGRSPTFRVAGWISGQEAQRPEYLQSYGNRPTAYFVPVTALNGALSEIP